MLDGVDNLVAKRSSLTERERRFVVAYCGDAAGNATRAAELAGYSRRSARFQGSKLATKRNIQIAIDAYRQELARPTIADAVERREMLTTMLRAAGQHPLARLKAVDILNKMDGLYLTKLANPDGSPLHLVPDAELDARIQQLEQQVRS